MDDLRRQIVRGSNLRARFLECLRQYFSDSEIADLDKALLSHEDILTFKVTVNYFAIMNVLHSEAYLSEPIEDLVLRERSTALVLDPFLQITTVAVVHDDAKLASLSFEDLNKGHDVRMIECFQQSCFLDSFSLFALRHALNVNHLHNTHVGVLDSSDEKGLAERSLTQQFDFLVCLEFRTLFDTMHLHHRIYHDLFYL